MNISIHIDTPKYTVIHIAVPARNKVVAENEFRNIQMFMINTSKRDIQSGK